MLGVGTLLAAALGLGLISAKGAAARDEPSGREQMKAEKLIQQNLQNDRDLANNPIDVKVADGVATLKGTVDSDTERDTAVRLASVTGVRVVDDQLKVGSAGAKATLEDSAITTKVKTEILANTDLRRADISVATDNGVVTLTGTVPSQEMRRLAVDLARHTGGVDRVEDHLRVLGSTPSDPEVPHATR
jgi:hyperosmotically inducible protein